MIRAKKSTVASLMVALALVGYSLPPVAAADGAKGLFFEQLESPDKSLNTGLQYWIELHRDGKQTKVTNKFAFKNGDKIKFHVKSNVDGYSYILLKSGSRGEQSVLFPDPDTGDDNHVKRGEDYILPGVGFLTFDENPGLEKVSLVLSRTPIDAQAYLSGPKEAPVLVASAMTGSKDLIPQRVLVHFSDNEPAQKIASKPPKEVEKIDSTTKVATNKPNKPLNGTKGGITPVKVVAKKGSDPAPKSKKEKASDDLGSVTVVSELPGNVLHIDVDLHHI